MVCDICTDTQKKDMYMTKAKGNVTVKPGEMWNVSLNVVSIAGWPGDTFELNVKDLDTGECIFQSGNVPLPGGTTVPIAFQGFMPDRNLKLGLSLWDINPWYYGLYDDCEDYQEVLIKKGTVTIIDGNGNGEPPIDWSKYAMYGGVAAVLIGTYWLVTRKPEAVKRGYEKGKGFVLSEYEKGKKAYETYKEREK